MKLLFVVEGFTDIRFVKGLSEIAELTMLVPARQYRSSGLDKRIAQENLRIQVDEIPGSRLQYQVRAFSYLWQNATKFDVILSQEALRGSLNSSIVGALRGIPVVNYVCIAPVEYFQCRRERGQNSAFRNWLGTTVIRSLLTINGALATKWVALGPYLYDLCSRYSKRVKLGYYYGIDTDLYIPLADTCQRRELRRQLNLPEDKFLIFLSSRISHEKDPETVLQAVAAARKAGLDAAVFNLGGGFQDFLNLARQMRLPDADQWVIGRPAAHPMYDLPRYYQAADCLAQASLSEGGGMSPLEALACGTPAVCTAVGGMAQILKSHARLTPRRDPEAMAKEFLWIAANPDEARKQALEARQFVIREWNRNRAFQSLAEILEECCREAAAKRN